MDINTDKITDIPILRQLFETALKDGKIEKIPIYLDVSVLDAYRTNDSYTIIRTDTSGRISKKGLWAVDFGISNAETIIQVTAGNFVYRLPENEKDHWIDHIVTITSSENFIKGAIRPGCLDDGDIRNW